MKFTSINKYILKSIFSYLKISNQLNIVKYSKKMMSLLDITKYTYQKYYFDLIKSPAFLNFPEILKENKIFDEKTLKKLMSGWENETTEIIKESDCFHFNQRTKSKDIKNIKILNIIKDAKSLKKNMPNLIELNLSKIKNLELPCSILLNLETLSLTDISKLKFLTNENHISLQNLKHLYLNNISFNKKNKLKINVDNLKYLDLRLKEQDGDDEDCNYDNNNNTSGFYKEKTIGYLIKIFNFKNLSIFDIDLNNDEENEENEGNKKNKREKEDKGNEENEDEENEENDDNEDEENEEKEDNEDNEEYEDDLIGMDKYESFEDAFKNPQEVFNVKNLKKLNYFNFEILYEYYDVCGAAEYNDKLVYKYIFYKTKEDKYVFKTLYDNIHNCNGEMFKSNQKEIRNCEKINYNNYYFINKELYLSGEKLENIELDYENLKSFNITSELNDDRQDSQELINYLENIQKDNNCLETISLDILDLDKKTNLLENLKKFTELKCFYVKNNCLFKDNKQLIKLLATLSNLKSLFSVEINIQAQLKLSKDDNKEIDKLFPDIFIQVNKKSSLIKWNNQNIIFKK